jgi:hypothetical protein
MTMPRRAPLVQFGVSLSGEREQCAIPGGIGDDRRPECGAQVATGYRDCDAQSFAHPRAGE